MKEDSSSKIIFNLGLNELNIFRTLSRVERLRESVALGFDQKFNLTNVEIIIMSRHIRYESNYNRE